MNLPKEYITCGYLDCPTHVYWGGKLLSIIDGDVRVNNCGAIAFRKPFTCHPGIEMNMFSAYVNPDTLSAMGIEYHFIKHRKPIRPIKETIGAQIRARCFGSYAVIDWDHNHLIGILNKFGDGARVTITFEGTPRT